MNTLSKWFYFAGIALAAGLLLVLPSWAGDPVQGPKQAPLVIPAKMDHDPNVVLVVEGPQLRVPLGMEFEERFFHAGEDTESQNDQAYAVAVTSVRFRDYDTHQICELDWAPFGRDPGTLPNLANNKDVLLGPDQSWVALPLYTTGGIYFESLDTLQHSLQTNQAAGFLLTCEGKDKPFEENVICGYQIQKWTGPHTLLLDLSVGESNSTLKVNLEKRTTEGKLPIGNSKIVFGPLKDLCSKKKPSMKPAAAP